MVKVNAITLAAEEINAAGGIGGRPIELVVYDTQSDNTRYQEFMRRVLQVGEPVRQRPRSQYVTLGGLYQISVSLRRIGRLQTSMVAKAASKLRALIFTSISALKNAASLLRPRLNHFATIICPCRSPSVNNPLATSRNVPLANGLPLSSTASVLEKLRLTAIAMWPGSLQLTTQSLHRAPRPTPFLFH
jgi:hypothetical protein